VNAKRHRRIPSRATRVAALFALVVVVALVVIGGGWLAMLLFRSDLPARAAARVNNERAASRESLPAPATAAAPDAPADVDTRAAILETAKPLPRREPAGVEMVSFPGLILVTGAKPADATEDGRLVLRNADPAARPLRIELDVRDGRFEGKGPIDAVVRVESLKLCGHPLATYDRTWKLADRWIEIGATYSPNRVLHVVDAPSGRELTGVVFAANIHDEGSALDDTGFEEKILESGMVIVQGAAIRRKSLVHESPIQLFHRGERPEMVVHVADHGDEWVRFEENELEKTVAMHAPARLQVQLEPWTPAPPDPLHPYVRRPHVVVGLVVDRSEGREAARMEADRRQIATLPPSLQPLAQVAFERRRRRTEAQTSPLMHRAEVDASGVANFADLCAGPWIAWIDDPSNPASNMVEVVHGRQWSDFENRELQRDPVEFTLGIGDTASLVLDASFVPPPAGFATLHFLDAKTRGPVELEPFEIEPWPLDRKERDVDFPYSNWLHPAPSRTSPSALTFELPAGLTTIHLRPRPGSRLAPSDPVVEVAPGQSDFELLLPRRQGIDFVLVPHDVSGDPKADVLQVDLPIEVEGAARLAPFSDWRALRDEPAGRYVAACDGLAVGRHRVVVPENFGFLHPGTLEVDVRADEVTIVELEWTPPAAVLESMQVGPRGGGRDR